MQCPKCQHENPAGAKFCMECGEKLENLCPECGAKLPAEARFCMECGARLEEADSSTATAPVRLEDMQDRLYIPEPLRQKMDVARQQMEGENRLVTVLFADISGFTPMSQDLTPESLVDRVNQCFQVIIDAVYRYEGSVSRFMGDCVMAFFGAPLAHENDHERAILAALDIQQQVSQLGLNVSIGINTGMIYFGPVGTQEHREVSIYGSDVNLAARLQEAASRGQIFVSASTYRLTRRAFNFNQLDQLTLKGIGSPVSAYELLSIKERPEKLRGIEGLRARMVGREREFAELTEAADAWLNKGQGQMVSIIGEAGIGKSRLVRELKGALETGILSAEGESKERKAEDTESMSHIWLEGRCVSIGQPISYWPFIDVFRALFDLREDDGEKSFAGKVREEITRLLPNQAEYILPFVGNLMSIKFGDEMDSKLEGLSAEQIRHQTMLRVRDIFLTLAKRKPLVLVLEDLHWSDELSLDLIPLLMDELVTSHIMMICVYRPEREHKCYRLRTQAQRKCFERYTEIQLQKLTDRQGRQLVQSLLTMDNLTSNFREMILSKSEGNPFVIEEIIRSLMDRGVVYREGDRWKVHEGISEIDVPDTIHSVIMSRIDRLEAETKYVLQCASVIGRLFRYRLLGHLVRNERELDGYLEELEDRELVYEERSIPELEYAFKHALTQEAAYQGILEQRRREFHRQVAEGIERLYDDRIEEFYEELAHHWKRSRDDEKTLDYLVKAGSKAARSYLNEAAIDYYNQALELVKKMDVPGDRLAEIHELRAEVHHTMSSFEEAIEDWSKAAKLCTSSTRRARMLQRISSTYGWHMRARDKAARYIQEAIDAVDPEDKSREASIIYGFAALTFMRDIDPQEGARLFTRAIDISEEMGYTDLLPGHYVGLLWGYENFYTSVMNVYVSAGETQKVLDMMLEIMDSTMAFYGRQKVYPAVQIRWNNALENTYRAMLSIAPEVYHQFEGVIRSRLAKTDDPGERFFYFSQLLQLAMWGADLHTPSQSNGPRGSVGAYARDMGQLRSNAGTFAERIPEKIKSAIDLLSAQPDQLMKVAESVLKTVDNPKEIVELLDIISQILPDEEACLIVDWEMLKHLVLSRIPMMHITNDVLRLCADVCYWYMRCGNTDDLKSLAQGLQQAMSDRLEAWGISQLFPEPAELADPGQPALSEVFQQDPGSSNWEWVDPAGDCAYRLLKPGIEIDAQPWHDLWQDNLKGPRLLRQIEGDFMMETHVTDGTGGRKRGGLLVWKDERNYIRFEVPSSPGYWKDTVYYGANIDGKFIYSGVHRYDSEEAWLRLERRGDRFTAYVSSDREVWSRCGWTDISMRDPIKAGIHALCPQSPASSTRFEYLKLYRLMNNEK